MSRLSQQLSIHTQQQHIQPTSLTSNIQVLYTDTNEPEESALFRSGQRMHARVIFAVGKGVLSSYSTYTSLLNHAVILDSYVVCVVQCRIPWRGVSGAVGSRARLGCRSSGRQRWRLAPDNCRVKQLGSTSSLSPLPSLLPLTLRVP